jgi:YD repeat-containing protein
MTYDKANRMTAIDSQSQSYDAAGNQLTGHSVNRDLAYVYHYDHHNRLTGVFDSTDTTRKAAFTWDALGRRIAHTNDALGTTTRYFFDGVNELVEYADNGTGNGPRSRYYVHGVSYVDERLMMYDDDTDRPYYFVTDRMHNVRVIVDRAGAIRERYAYDPYGRPLIRELCGRGDMNDDTRMTTTPDDSRFSAAKAGSIWDPRADLDDDGDVDGADETAYHNKKPTWSSVMSAPTVSQAFSDFDNPYMFQGVPHFALDTAANATAEQLNLALNHHRARFVDVQRGRWTTKDPLYYNPNLPQRIALKYSGSGVTIAIRSIQRDLDFNDNDLYRSFGSNPISSGDPTGMLCGLCTTGFPCYSVTCNSGLCNNIAGGGPCLWNGQGVPIKFCAILFTCPNPGGTDCCGCR